MHGGWTTNMCTTEHLAWIVGESGNYCILTTFIRKSLCVFAYTYGMANLDQGPLNIKMKNKVYSSLYIIFNALILEKRNNDLRFVHGTVMMPQMIKINFIHIYTLSNKVKIFDNWFIKRLSVPNTHHIYSNQCDLTVMCVCGNTWRSVDIVLKACSTQMARRGALGILIALFVGCGSYKRGFTWALHQWPL